MAEAWELCLDDLPDDQLLACVKAHVRDPEQGRFWPVPGQLLRHRESLVELDLSPDIAWGQVLEEVRHRGYYAGAPARWSPNEVIDTAFIAGVRAAGGWRAICACEQDDIAAKAATFRRAFQTVLERGAQGHQLLPEAPSQPRITGTFQGLGGLLTTEQPRQVGVLAPESWGGRQDRADHQKAK